MQRNTFIVILSVVVIVLAAALIFLQVRGQKQAQRASSPQEIERQIQEVMNNPQIPEHAKQQIIYQLRMRQGAGKYMAPQQPSGK
jgi:flagellar basal body-associated protein FliL